jgi:hypothetical protein
VLDALAHPKRADFEFIDPKALDVAGFEGEPLHGETADGERAHRQRADADDGESGGDAGEGNL